MTLPDLAAGPRAPMPSAKNSGRATAKDEAENVLGAVSGASEEDVASDEVREKDAAKDFEAVLEGVDARPVAPDVAPIPPVAPPVADPALVVAPMLAAQPTVASVPEITAATAPQAVVAAVVADAMASGAEAPAEAPAPPQGEPAGMAGTARMPASADARPVAAPAEAAAPAAGPARAAPAELASAPEARPADRSIPDAISAASGVDATPASDTDPAEGKPRELGLSPSAIATPEWRLAAQAVSHARELPPAVHAAPRDVTQQITLAVSTATNGTVEIRLDPPELGRVHIHLTPTEQGGVVATVLAERPETHDFLRRHAETLTRDLNAAGYGSVSLEFSTGGQNAPAGRERWPEARGFAFGGTDLSTAAEAPATPRRPASSGSLDIRL